MKKIAGLTAAAAAAVCLAVPGGASAEVAAPNPVPECVQVVINNAPGFVLSTVGRAAEGELPRIMGPFLPC